MVNNATMFALESFDRELRSMAFEDYTVFEQQLSQQPTPAAASQTDDRKRDVLWSEHVHAFNWKLFDRAVPVYTSLAIQGLRIKASEWKLSQAEVADDDWQSLLADLQPPFAKRLFLWQKSKDELLKEMDTVVSMPGWGNIWTQPIINRVDMLATGVRTMIGVKVYGSDLDKIQQVSNEIAAVLRKIPGAADVVPDQSIGEGYLEIAIDREKAARYGVNVGDVQEVIEVALGGKTITTTVEGRERFPVRIRYARAFREDEESVKNLLVSVASPMGLPGAMGSEDVSAGARGQSAAAGMAAPSPSATNPFPDGAMQIPLGQIADVRIVQGPSMIKSENGLLRAYVQLNIRDRDVVGFVEEAQRAVAEGVKLPTGMYLEWSGQFEHQVRAETNADDHFADRVSDDFHPALCDVSRFSRCHAHDARRARRRRRRRVVPIPVRFQLQRGRVGRLHRLLRPGHADGRRDVDLSPRSGREPRRPRETFTRRIEAGCA